LPTIAPRRSSALAVVAADMRASVTRHEKKDEVCVYCLPSATSGTRRSLSAVTPIAAALLAVAIIDVRI